jgi:hypothetical protein
MNFLILNPNKRNSDNTYCTFCAGINQQTCSGSMFIVPHQASAILTCHNSISTRRIHPRRLTQSLACSATSNQNTFGSSLANRDGPSFTNRDWSSTAIISLPIERNWSIRGRLKWYRLGFVPDDSGRQPCTVFEFEYRRSADDHPLQRSCIFVFVFVRPSKRDRLRVVSLPRWLGADWRSCIFINIFGSCFYNYCRLLCKSNRPLKYFSNRVFQPSAIESNSSICAPKPSTSRHNAFGPITKTLRRFILDGIYEPCYNWG